MARGKLDPEILAHLEWIGFVRPTGLVVSAPALVRAGAILDRRDAEGQRLLRACSEDRTFGAGQDPVPCLPDFRAFAESVLDWGFSPKWYAGTDESPVAPELEVLLPDYDEVLRPDFAVRDKDPKEGSSAWQMLIRVLDAGQDFDCIEGGQGKLDASAQGRMERLLRQTGVPAGLLFNGRALRLISAPRGESSGWLDFRVADMVQTAGRPISTAMRLLLREARLLTLPRSQRLAALLEDSRRFQNEVSERLAEQVLHALYEFLRGFQAANDSSKGELLRQPLSEDPDEVYRALLTVVLRLVFLLFAEERDMLPGEGVFLRYYSLSGLYERLREDAALFPDTMDQRFGAWSQLLVLFRLIFDGAEVGEMHLPKRHGVLFDPDRFKFLEGRSDVGARQIHERVEAPLVPDGTIYRALEKLLVLEGERISYRALDVEQIGSVYETMMGFRLQTATGPSVAIKSPKPHGAPTTIDLSELLGQFPAKRERWLQDRTDRKLGNSVRRAIVSATSLEQVHAGLTPVVDLEATPDLVPAGAMVLQPSEERRRSGSHYTPRVLTEPIVRAALAPVLARLRGADGRPPRPEQILELKVADPAMGSGAFLVEACRELGDALVEAWHVWSEVPSIPPDEDEVTFARRQVAQRCLYGVDRNPVAVDLAKVSLWLVTLAKAHALTFVDHALRYGDSLMGLSRKQIEAFHWDADAMKFQAGFETMRVGDHVAKVADLRQRIREANEGVSDCELRDLWDEAQSELGVVRLFGDLVVDAFFAGTRSKEREAKRIEYAIAVVSGIADAYRPALDDRRHGSTPFAPFHWEIEFPEVFDRTNPGFDGIVGNPPFQGGRIISAIQGEIYSLWLLNVNRESSGGADLVAHFYRRAFDLLRSGGTFGLIATNTISQGDTRASGLRWICHHGGEIYEARRRVRWPGEAAVVVSVVHVIKGTLDAPKSLDGVETGKITAFLFHRGSSDDPARLIANAGLSFQGSIVLGMGFTFDDTDPSGIATPLEEMRRLLRLNPDNQEVIYPYIGGEEVNSGPTHAHHRYVIDFGERSEEECRRRWPDLMAIVEARVRPERIGKDRVKYPRMVDEWWKFWNPRPELRAAIAKVERVLVVSRVSRTCAFTFVPAGMVYSLDLIVFVLPPLGFGILQSRPHELWARFFGSSMKDDLRYSPTDCFQTFPFPDKWQDCPAVEAAGSAYYEFRASVMANNAEGLTKTYNRFHDPGESDPNILRLRGLHAAMDRSVLDAYGWNDIPTECEFLLDYEVDDEDGGDRRKPWHYRWPDAVRDEVLARLLELNTQRANEQARMGLGKAEMGDRRPRKKHRPESPQLEGFFS